MELAEIQAAPPEPKQAFFIVRARLARVGSATPEADERRLTLHIQREGDDADNADSLEPIVRTRLAHNLPGYLITEYSAVQVVQSTYLASKLMQSGKKALELDQTQVSTPNPQGDYQIVPSPMSPMYHRVIAPDGTESALYSFEECQEIVRLAKQGVLLGSFGSDPQE